MIRIYIDTEFDSIKNHGKFYQSVISIGAIMTDRKGEFIDSFYRLSRPKQFQRINPIVEKMTGLKSIDILNASRFEEVMEEFILWIKKYTNIDELVVYAYGPDDRRTLMGENERANLKYKKLFDGIINLQQEISTHTFFHNQMLSSTLSLEDAKNLYGVEGDVEHNALTDAIDLHHLHLAYLTNQLDFNEAQKIYQKLEEKEQIEENKKLKAFQRKLMKEFGENLNEKKLLKAYRPTLDILKEWTKNDLQMTKLKEVKIEEGQELYFSIQKGRNNIYFIMNLNKDGIDIRNQCMVTLKNKGYINALLGQWEVAQESYKDNPMFSFK